MLTLTQWFNGHDNPPVETGRYEVRTVEQWRNAKAVMPQCFAVWNGKGWEIPNYYTDSKSKTILSYGWHGYIEWRGVVQFQCTGCGRKCFDPHDDLMELRTAGHISCCPDRDMIGIK